MTCDRLIGPYPCCSVVQGDCLELMKALPDGCVDAVITDPPYGIGASFDVCRHGHPKTSWDSAPASQSAMVMIRTVSTEQIIWGWNYLELPPSQGFLLWDKQQPEDFSLAMCEVAWWSESRPAQLFRLRPQIAERFHPTQKPLELMFWCIQKAGDAETILDPFCGSGTTLVAAKKLGRHFLGFEISEEYCAIARDRLARIDAQPSLFEPKPEQLTLGGD